MIHAKKRETVRSPGLLSFHLALPVTSPAARTSAHARSGGFTVADVKRHNLHAWIQPATGGLLFAEHPGRGLCCLGILDDRIQFDINQVAPMVHMLGQGGHIVRFQDVPAQN